MPLTFDLDAIEADQRQPELQELLLQNRFPIDVSTGSLDQVRVATTAESFVGLFMVSCDGRSAFVHRGERRVSRPR